MKQTHSLAVARLQKEYLMIQKEPLEQGVAKPDPNNIFLWHFLIYNLKEEYQNGYYHGVIKIPVDYPFKPPKIEFVTPNGRFKTGEQICLSFTNYHPESWSTSWTIKNMLLGLISFMITEQSTKGSVLSSNYEKQKLAQKSLLFNLKNKQFVDVFQSDFQMLKIDPNLALEDNLKAYENQVVKEVGGGDLTKYQKLFLAGLFLLVLFLAIKLYLQK